MTGVEKFPTAKPGLPFRVQRLATVGASVIGLTLVSMITTSVVVLPRSVAADQVSNLKSQAAQIARDLVLEQLQIGTYRQQYDVDNAKVQRDQVAIDSTEQLVQSDVDRVSRDRKSLETEALSAYINMDPDVNQTQVLFEGNPTDRVARAEYEEVTTGDMNLTIDVLHTAENALRAERITLGQQVSRDRATASEAEAQDVSAHQVQVELQSKQSEVTGQLAVAVDQQQAAQAAAAARAVRAAQVAAATTSKAKSSSSTRSSSTTSAAPSSTSTSTQGSPAGATGDPSLPPFLQCVLQVESGGNYQAVSPGGTYMGGFQFSQPTWNEAAQLAGMPQLVGLPPNKATPAEQDDLAIALYQADGDQPWDDSCRNR